MKKLVFVSLLLSGTLLMGATPISPAASLKRALRQTPERIAGPSKESEFKLSGTYDFEDTAGVYLFSRNDGKAFVVTSADDSSPALLGYGYTSATDPNGDVAPQCAYWLSELARQVAYCATRTSTGIPLRSRPDRAPVSPLCSTLWNQSAPYNDMCPEKDGERAVTGCVATSMAQVMKYHNWPEHGEGKKDYTCKPYGRLRINYLKEFFDWDNMLDSYTEESPQECKDAVAQLMKCAGYSVEMQYSPRASGAASINIAQALGQYFCYDKSLSYLFRDYYSLYDWEDLIYASLVNDGPVIYDGQSGIGGHSFVCDGYDTDGYFHFNWGWGGVSDGYFLLDALDPLHQGIGGADGGFDYMQDVILGIRPDTGRTSTWNACLIINSNLELSYDKEENGVVADGTVFNIGPGPLAADARLGMRYTPLDGGEPIDELFIIEQEVPVGYGFTQFGADIPELADGQYKVELVYSLSPEGDDLRPVLAPLYDSGVSILTVGDGDPRFELVEPGFPEFIDAVYPDEIILSSPVHVTGRIENPTDNPMLGILTVVVLTTDMDALIGYSNPWACDLEAGESRELDINTMISNQQTRPAGDMECCVALAELNVRTGQIALLSDPATAVIKPGSGITLNSTEADEADTGWFTTQGMSLGKNSPVEPGVYIIRRGNETRKIIIR